VASHDQRVERGGDEPHTRYYVACALSLLGESAAGLDQLERAAARRPAFTGRRAASDPDLAGLSGDERFDRVTAAWHGAGR
jgi:hypothetical protein